MLPGGEKVESGGLALPDLCTALVRCLSPAVWVEESADDGGEEKKVKTAGWVWKTAGKQKKLVLAAGIFQGLTAFGGIIFALLMRRVIDAAAAGRGEDFRQNLLFLSGLLLLQILLRCGVRFFTEEARAALENQFRLTVFRGILGKDYRETSAYHTGELMNRITADASAAADTLVTLFPSAADMAVRIGGVLAVMGALAPWLALFLFLGGIFLAALSILPRKWMKRAHHRVQEADGKVRSFLQESLENLLTIRAFGCQEKIESRGAEQMNGHRRVRRRRNLLSNGFATGLNALFQCAYLAGFLWGTSGILAHTVSYGTLTAVMQLIGQLQAPFVNLGGAVPKLGALSASAERMMELTEGSRDISSRAEGVQEVYKKMDALCFSHVSFRYKEGERQVLKDLSFSLPKGTMAAIVGKSGIGKSTVMKLILSVYRPEEGEIFLDMGQEKLPIRQVPEGFFAYVPQGNGLMSGTIEEVVSFAGKDGQIDGKRVKEACQAACAWDFICALPGGMEARIGERGAGLSEGQMQRLAVARAVYSGCPVLLLDEATSALDPATEKELIRNLKNLPGRTVFLITHRREAWEMCDRILEQKEGEIQ